MFLLDMADGDDFNDTYMGFFPNENSMPSGDGSSPETCSRSSSKIDAIAYLGAQ